MFSENFERRALRLLIFFGTLLLASIMIAHIGAFAIGNVSLFVMILRCAISLVVFILAYMFIVFLWNKFRSDF